MKKKGNQKAEKEAEKEKVRIVLIMEYKWNS